MFLFAVVPPFVAALSVGRKIPRMCEQDATLSIELALYKHPVTDSTHTASINHMQMMGAAE